MLLNARDDGPVAHSKILLALHDCQPARQAFYFLTFRSPYARTGMSFSPSIFSSGVSYARISMEKPKLGSALIQASCCSPASISRPNPRRLSLKFWARSEGRRSHSDKTREVCHVQHSQSSSTSRCRADLARWCLPGRVGCCTAFGTDCPVERSRPARNASQLLFSPFSR